MTTNILYKVSPADSNSLFLYVKPDPTGRQILFNLFTILLFIYGVVCFFNSFMYLNEKPFNIWVLLAGIFFIAISIWCFFVIKKLYKKADYLARLDKVNKEAEYYTSFLNELLKRSYHISINILPFYDASAKKSLDIAKVDYSENAITPFWEKIEETSKSLALFKEAVDQLSINGEIYSKLLDGKKHNFPMSFPIGTNLSISQTILDDFNSTIRKGQTNTGFATIWEIRRNTAVNIAGFKTLEQAIHNMKDAIVSSIYNLKQSIKSDFRELKNIQLEQMKYFETSQRIIDNTFKEMDTKLYYIMYDEKPHTPFVRPFFER